MSRSPIQITVLPLRWQDTIKKVALYNRMGAEEIRDVILSTFDLKSDLELTGVMNPNTGELFSLSRIARMPDVLKDCDAAQLTFTSGDTEHISVDLTVPADASLIDDTNAIPVTNCSDLLRRLSHAGNTLVVVQFHADWCPACQELRPEFDRLSLVYKTCIFLEIDANESRFTAHEMRVSVVPTYLFYWNCRKICELIGPTRDELEQHVEQTVLAAFENPTLEDPDMDVDPFPMSPMRPRRKPGRGAAVTVAGAAVAPEQSGGGDEAGAGCRSARSGASARRSPEAVVIGEKTDEFVAATRPWKSSITGRNFPDSRTIGAVDRLRASDLACEEAAEETQELYANLHRQLDDLSPLFSREERIALITSSLAMSMQLTPQQLAAFVSMCVEAEDEFLRYIDEFERSSEWSAFVARIFALVESSMNSSEDEEEDEDEDDDVIFGGCIGEEMTADGVAIVRANLLPPREGKSTTPKINKINACGIRPPSGRKSAGKTALRSTAARDSGMSPSLAAFLAVRRGAGAKRGSMNVSISALSTATNVADSEMGRELRQLEEDEENGENLAPESTPMVPPSVQRSLYLTSKLRDEETVSPHECVMLQYLTALGDNVLMAAISIYEDEDDWAEFKDTVFRRLQAFAGELEQMSNKLYLKNALKITANLLQQESLTDKQVSSVIWLIAQEDEDCSQCFGRFANRPKSLQSLDDLRSELLKCLEAELVESQCGDDADSDSEGALSEERAAYCGTANVGAGLASASTKTSANGAKQNGGTDADADAGQGIDTSLSPVVVLSAALNSVESSAADDSAAAEKQHTESLESEMRDVLIDDIGAAVRNGIGGTSTAANGGGAASTAAGGGGSLIEPVHTPTPSPTPALAPAASSDESLAVVDSKTITGDTDESVSTLAKNVKNVEAS